MGRATLQVVAYLLDLPDLADRIERTCPPFPDSTHYFHDYGAWLVSAAQALHAGDPQESLRLLRQVRTSQLKYDVWETLADFLFAQAFQELDQVDSAIAYLEAVIQPARVGGYFPLFSRVQLPIALLRLAELEEHRGNTAGAALHYSRFLELWSDPDPELRAQVEAVQRKLKRLAADTTD